MGINRERKDAVQELFEVTAGFAMLVWPMCVKLKAQHRIRHEISPAHLYSDCSRFKALKS